MGKIYDRLKESLELAELLHAPKEREEILFLPVSELKLNPNRVRKKVVREDITDMAKNLKMFGILQPLEINEKRDNCIKRLSNLCLIKKTKRY